MNTKIIISTTLLVLVVSLSTSVPVFAHTSNYNTGYSQGQTKGESDYYLNDNGHNDYRPICPTYDSWTEQNGPHSSNFCAGFVDGYKAKWNELAPNFMASRVQQTTDQNSNINIKGSNNRVTVNQQVNNNVGGQNSGGYGSYGNGHAILPKCFILCSNIQVR